jgi:hypothetical protein
VAGVVMISSQEDVEMHQASLHKEQSDKETTAATEDRLEWNGTGSK